MISKKHIEWIQYIPLVLLTVAAVSIDLWGKVRKDPPLSLVIFAVLAYMIQQITTNYNILGSLEQLKKERPIYQILNYSDYYKKLKLIILNAKDQIDLMSMQAQPPGLYDVKELKSYFDSIDDLIQNTSIRVRRLVSIQTEEKLTWVEDTIIKHKDCTNFYLSYVDLNILYDKGVFKKRKELLPYPVNIQIIDNEHLFLINPELGYFEPDLDSNYIYIHSKEVGTVFASYYLRYWQMSEIIVSGGKILKEGTILMDNLIKQLKIEKQ